MKIRPKWHNLNLTDKVSIYAVKFKQIFRKSEQKIKFLTGEMTFQANWWKQAKKRENLIKHHEAPSKLITLKPKGKRVLKKLMKLCLKRLSSNQTS